MNKKFTLVLIFIFAVSSLLLITPCVAPITMHPTPSSAPEVISVEIYNNPSVIEPGYYTDPYTGEKHQINGGYVEPRGNVTITIKNQPFTAYTDENGNNINIYYIIWWKTPESIDFVLQFSRSVYQSDTTYTKYTFTYGVEGLLPITTEHNDGGQVIDFRVQAVTGHFKQGIVYEGEGSAFTEFTITIPYRSGTSKPNIQPTSVVPSALNPNVPQNTAQQNLPRSNPLIILVSVCIIVVLIAVVLIAIIVCLLFSRQRKPETVVVGGVGCEVKPE